MPVSFFMTAALAAFYTGAASGNRRWYIAFYAAMASAALTKGLIGIILPGGIAFWYIVLTRRWRIMRDALYPPGILIFFAVSVPWFYLVCKANPDFFRFFFIQEHFLRYMTKMHDRYEPFWFYLPMIPAGMVPWTGFFFSLSGRGSVLRSPGSDENRGANIFLLLWFGIILTFFSLSGSKLIPYIVPCVPPLAILIAANMSRMMDENRWIGGALAWNSGISLAVSAALLAFAAINEYTGNFKATPAMFPAAAALSGGAILVLVVWRRTRDVKRSAAAMCAGAVIFVLGLQTLYILVAERKSVFEVSSAVSAKKLPGETIAVYGEILQSVPFYAKERVMLVNSMGELKYGAEDENERDRAHWFPDGAGFLRRWRGGEPLALIIRKEYVKELFGDEAVSELKNKNATEAGGYVIIFNRESAMDDED
jgi:4-amino-4-deoxy-L-arabinose transferase-like glycosyltransferase